MAKHPDDASKLVGTFLDLDNSELLKMINDPDFLDEKLTKALSVLRSCKFCFVDNQLK